MVRANGRVGQAHVKIADLSLKNPPSKKSSAIEFLNRTLHAREARGTAKPHWFSLVGGKENQSENDLVPKVVRVYRAARTYFQSQSD
ncbi:MAG: hypothetical protein HZB12_03050 [Candidatus Yonathbacteria bacterium]|nr:hypothetical protein [Candidatus Yonathbacteria bacterium]